MRRVAILTAVVFATVACQPPIEDKLAGDWTGPQNSTVNFTKDKKWTSDIPMGMTTLKTAGSWKASGDTVTMTPETINGTPAAQMVTQITDIAKKMGAKPKDLASLADLAKADDFTLSADGKTLTLKNPKQQAVTLTKK